MTTKPEATQGTGAALKRAEEAEKHCHDVWLAEDRAYTEYLEKNPEPDANVMIAMKKNVKLAFDMYKGARDGLLSYDNKVDQSKRLSGNMLPESEVSRILRMFVRHFSIGLELGINEFSQTIVECKAPVDACEVAGPIWRGAVVRAITTATRDTTKEGMLPGFCIEALEGEL